VIFEHLIDERGSFKFNLHFHVTSKPIRYYHGSGDMFYDFSHFRKTFSQMNSRLSLSIAELIQPHLLVSVIESLATT
jgi:hypothetical protein